MNLREAAQQALETLELLQVTPDPDLLDGHKWPIRWLDNSVTVTLTPPLLKSRGRATKLRAIQMSLGYQHGAAIATLRAALAEDALERMSEDERRLGIQMQPVLEPVAWMDIASDGTRLSVRMWSDGNFEEVPLYTMPPQRKPLTEAQIYAAIKHIDSLKAVEVARAVEKAHGIGGSND